MYYSRAVITGLVYSVTRPSLRYTTTLYTAVVRVTPLKYAYYGKLGSEISRVTEVNFLQFIDLRKIFKKV